MLDGKVLAACLQSGEAYRQVKDHVVSSELSPQGAAWWELVKEWYDRDPEARSVDVDLLREIGAKRLPEVHQETLQGWLKHLPVIDSPTNVTAFLLDLKRYQVGNKLSQAIQTRDEKSLSRLLEEYVELRSSTKLGKSEVKWTMDDGEMTAMLSRANLIKVAPQKLNDKLKGGAARGDHILVFGRPESGKTLLTVNMVAGFLKQKLKVLYIGNEESTYKCRKRIVCSLVGATSDQFEEDPARVLERANELGLGGLFICHMSPGTLVEIEDLTRELRPDVLVVDQIRNLEGKGDGMTAKLNELGKDFRNILGKYDCLGVSVTQAGDRDRDQAILEMGDIDHSRTGLPAACDVIVGVGVNEELKALGMRMVSLPKNKLNDEEDGREAFQIQVDLKRSKAR